MTSGVAMLRPAAFLPLQVLCLLFLAGCNLDFTPDDPSPSFDGPPLIHIAAPQPNQKFQSGATVIVQARVENAGPDIARIAVLLNGDLMGERLNPNETNAEVLPLTIDWPTSNAGDYTITVVAERGDGSSAREDVNIVVVSPSQFDAPDAETSTPESADQPPAAAEAPVQAEGAAATAGASAPPQASATIAPAADAGPSQVAGKVIRPAPLRPGPGADSGQPVGSLMVDDDILIVAVNPAGSWYRVRRGAEIDAWVDASLVAAAEDLSGIPIETGAPQPPEPGVNLVVTRIELAPDPPVCGLTTIVRANIRNNGALDSQISPWVVANALLLSDESIQAQNPDTVYLTALAAGEEAVLEIPLTLTARYAEAHVIRVTVDYGNHVLETHEDDNTGDSRQFELSQGTCSA